jgi:glycosyltransferase involved in cell wall biosynthesis
VREFVRELHAQGMAVELIDLPEWGPSRLPNELRDPWFESLDRHVGARTTLHFCMPHQVVPEPGQLTANYTMFEASRISRGWVEHSLHHDLVILPTESSRRAWVDGGVPAERLQLCPLGIDARRFGQPAAPLDLGLAGTERVERYRVRFLNVSALGPRKNLKGLLRAWLRATDATDDAVLVLKLGAHAPGWLEVFWRELDEAQRELDTPLEQAAPLHLVQAIYSDAEIPRLYAAATHYVSLSFGEGWDQAMMEAAAAGLRLIAPQHSAYVAYLDPSVAQMIPSHAVPAVYQHDPALAALFAGASWWAPSEDAAVGAIRRAIEGRDTPLGSARERVLRDFTWEQATRRLIAMLGEAEVAGIGRRLA